MAQLSDRLKRLAPSETLAMSQKSSELKAQGIDVINMSVGEPDFMTPNHVKEAGKKAIDDNYSKYSPVPGYLILREAISRKLILIILPRRLSLVPAVSKVFVTQF